MKRTIAMCAVFILSACPPASNDDERPADDDERPADDERPDDDDSNDDDDDDDDDDDITDEGCVAAEDCADLVYTACSCAPSDPCGWQSDGTCDAACEENFASAFNDDGDCLGGEGEGEGEGEAPACAPDTTYEQCVGGRYSVCTCAASDPCGWANDGTCDDDVCAPNFGVDFNDVDCNACGPELTDRDCTTNYRLCIEGRCVAPEVLTCPGETAYINPSEIGAPILYDHVFARAPDFDDTCQSLGGAEAVIFNARLAEYVVVSTVDGPDVIVTWGDGTDTYDAQSPDLSDDPDGQATAFLLCSPRAGLGVVGASIRLRFYAFSGQGSNLVCGVVQQ